MIENDLLKPVPNLEKAGWKTTIGNSEGNSSSPEIAFLESINSRLGLEVSYGQGPDGYDQWVIKEPHGGGSVIVPFIRIDGELYVGANRQKRSLAGGYITEVPRGFALPTETHEEAAKREFQEETGAVNSLAERVMPLAGKKVNVNTAYFQTNPRKGEGVKFFGVELSRNEVILRRDSNDPRRRVYKFTSELAGEIKEVNEKIKPEGIRFFHSSLLAETPDGITLQAIGKLVAQR